MKNGGLSTQSHMFARMRLGVALLVGFFMTVFILANAHLVYVAVTSQPDCVPHRKTPGNTDEASSFRAARSAC